MAAVAPRIPLPTVSPIRMSAATRLKSAARVILVGAPGVGKGTQSERMMKRYPELSAISSGDLLRNAVRTKTQIGVHTSPSTDASPQLDTNSTGLEAAEIMKAGALVPDAVILRLILRELQARAFIPTGSSLSDALQTGQQIAASDSPSASFLLDGFPRTAQQAQRLDGLLPPNFVVHLQTPTDILLSRIASRWVHEPSGRVYNIGFNTPRVPGRDDVTGEPLIQREDDSEEVWRNRLKKFDADSGPLLDWYENMGVLWRVKGNTSDEISPQLFKEFERRFA